MSAAPSTRAMASPVMPRFYSAARLSRNALSKKNAGNRPRFSRLRLRSAACLDHAVDDSDFVAAAPARGRGLREQDRKSTRLNSSHTVISYAVFCLKKKKK